MSNMSRASVIADGRTIKTKAPRHHELGRNTIRDQGLSDTGRSPLGELLIVRTTTDVIGDEIIMLGHNGKTTDGKTNGALAKEEPSEKDLVVEEV